MSAVKKIVNKANQNVNKVMRVVDPIGAYLKEKTETASQKEAQKLLGGLFGGGSKPRDSGGQGVATGGNAVSEESLTSVKARREQRLQRRQGNGTGSTLLMTEDDTRLQGSTLLGE